MDQTLDSQPRGPWFKPTCHSSSCTLGQGSLFKLPCPSVSSGGVMVYWSIHSTLTLRARVRISPSPRHICPSARRFIHIAALDPGCINGDPVGGDRLLCLNLPAPLYFYRLLYQARNAPWGVEIVHCKCGIEMYPMTGVIICCKRFGPHWKSAYKN